MSYPLSVRTNSVVSDERKKEIRETLMEVKGVLSVSLSSSEDGTRLEIQVEITDNKIREDLKMHMRNLLRP